MDSIRSICHAILRCLWQDGAESLLVLMPKLRETWYSLLGSDPRLDLSKCPIGRDYKETFWRTCACDEFVVRHLQNRHILMTADIEEMAKGGTGSRYHPCED